MEYTRAIQRKRAIETAVVAADNVKESKDEELVHETGERGLEEDHNVLQYGMWFMFCQRCKHGGHAGCLEKWFSNSSNGRQRRVCGVNGCNCLCHDVGL